MLIFSASSYNHLYNNGSVVTKLVNTLKVNEGAGGIYGKKVVPQFINSS